MMKERRWLKSAIAASAEPMPALPWARATRVKPTAFKPVPARAQAVAAH